MTGEGAILNTSQFYTVKYVIISPNNLTCHVTDNTFCCEACRLVQVAWQPHLRICIDFKFGPRNRGSFVRSRSIQKENKRTRRTQIKRDVENFKLGRNPVSYIGRKPRFCKRRV